MFFQSFVFALSAISAVSATNGGGDNCNADNCLRALRATHNPTRLSQASIDCAQIIDITYTPPVVTITAYSTVTQTDFVTVPTTVVESIHDTQTNTIRVTVTATEQVTITDLVKRKRRRTASDTSTSISLPAYAAPCSDFDRFSSACSCIGVDPRVFTASTPSTTITLPVTETVLTTVTEAVETTSVTVIDTTVSVTTTVTTVVPHRPTFTGVGKIYEDGVDVGMWVGAEFISGGMTPIRINSFSDAITLKLDENGHLWYGNLVARRFSMEQGAPVLVQFLDPDLNSPFRERLVCSNSEAPNNVLDCKIKVENHIFFLCGCNNCIIPERWRKICNDSISLVID